MHIDKNIWPKFNTYLTIDKKISDKPASDIPNKSRFNKIAKWFAVREFNRDGVNLFLSELKTSGYKLNYLNNLITVLKHLDKHLNVNQIQDYSYFKSIIKKGPVINKDEIRALANVHIDYTKCSEYLNQRECVLIMFIGTTGCRIGEALNLKWDDIRENVAQVEFIDTKNGDNRLIPIDPDVHELLKKLPRTSDYVFCSYRGKQMRYQEFNIDLKRRAEQVGIMKNISAHTFRRSYITTMIGESHVDSLEVAYLVGHKDPKTTMRYLNSSLDHYAEIIQLHPLLRGHLQIDQLSQRTKTFVDTLADPAKYKVTYIRDRGKTLFEIDDIFYEEDQARLNLPQ